MSDRTPKRELGVVTRVGPKGEVVIPKRLRDQLGIAPGDAIEIVPEGAAIRIELMKWPEGLRGRFKGSGLVAELEAEHRQLRS